MGMLPSGQPPTPTKAPKPTDPSKAMMNALAYAQTERRLRQGSGAAGSFKVQPGQGRSLLGM